MPIIYNSKDGEDARDAANILAGDQLKNWFNCFKDKITLSVLKPKSLDWLKKPGHVIYNEKLNLLTFTYDDYSQIEYNLVNVLVGYESRGRDKPYILFKTIIGTYKITHYEIQ